MSEQPWEPRRTSDHGVPLSGAGVTFVKLSNYYYSKRGVGTAVHIESGDQPYGGDSLTLCGRTLRIGAYLFLFVWESDLGYRTCTQCHKAYERGKR
jgi:hypothetical protein